MTILPPERKTHVLVFPYPAQGHMIPLLDLTRHLATRPGSPLTLTVLVTPANLPFLNPLLSLPNVQPLTLPFPGHPSIPAGVENNKDLPTSAYFRFVMHALGGLYGPLMEWFRAHPSPPVAIISDMFLGWTHRLACELGIPRVVFSPSGAMALAVVYALWKDMPPKRGEDEVVVFDNLPTRPLFPWAHLSPIYRSYVEGDPLSEFVREGNIANRESWGLVLNTFDGIESVYLDHFRKELGHDRFWAVGPVNPDGIKERGGPASARDEVLTWLDTREEEGDKVIYVCFGSQAVLSNEQMAALALALESSGAHFVWSVKIPTSGHLGKGYGEIPEGFKERVEGRGLVVTGWAPQVEILGHKAVASFLTHCGWNSVLEGLTVGVTMLAWPMGADQFTNATLLVDELKVGLTVCERSDTVPDSALLARAIAESVSGEGDMAKRAQAIREAGEAATAEGGTSYKQLDDLVKRLSSLGFGSAPIK